MPSQLHRRSYRFTDADVARLAFLAERTGGIAPATDTAVIREALRRFERQVKAGEKSQKKSGSSLDWS
jgi:hypothetical protein